MHVKAYTRTDETHAVSCPMVLDESLEPFAPAYAQRRKDRKPGFGIALDGEGAAWVAMHVDVITKNVLVVRQVDQLKEEAEFAVFGLPSPRDAHIDTLI